MTDQAAEWVTIANSVVLIAHEQGDVWIRALDDASPTDPFAEPMTCEGNQATTTALLDMAINLGFAGIDTPPDVPAPDLPHHVMALAGAYHTSRDTPRNLRLAAARFRELGRPELTELLEQKAVYETGHERLALKDLNALGLPGQRIVDNLVPAAVKPLCERFDRLCADVYPIECVGFAYCFERIAAMKKKPDVDAVKAVCPEGVDATRFLRTHSSLGTEARHVEDMIDFIWRLPSGDRIRIVQSTYQTALLLAEGYEREGRMSGAEIHALFQEAAGEPLDGAVWDGVQAVA